MSFCGVDGSSIFGLPKGTVVCLKEKCHKGPHLMLKNKTLLGTEADEIISIEYYKEVRT